MRPLETIGADVASKATYTGASTTVFASLLQIDWAVFIGVIVGVAGLIINLYFKIREDKRREKKREEEHQLFKKQLNTKDNLDEC